LSEKAKPPKVMHITLNDPERIQAYKPALGLPAWHPASGFSLREYRAPRRTSGRSYRPVKLEYRRDNI
jgi:hypothetical protein